MAGRNKPNKSEKSRHLVSLDYLRVLAVIFILYDHLVGMRTQTWPGKRVISFLFTNPLHIIQDFGALGVSIFFIISGFLMGSSIDSEYNKCLKREIKNVEQVDLRTRRISYVFIARGLRIYISAVVAMAVFGIVQYMCRKIICQTYWSQFTLDEWVQGATLIGYFTGLGDKINGTTWFLVPLFYFYLLSQVLLWLRCKKGWTFALNALQIFGMAAPACIRALYVIGIFRTSYYFEFVYIPVFGILAYAFLTKIEDSEQEASGRKTPIKHAGRGILRLLVNYLTMVLAFYYLNIDYYSNEPYIVSVIYAFFIFLFFYYNECMFKESKFISFIVGISLPIYLLQQTWGAWLMGILGESQHFSISLVASLIALIGLAWIHNKLIDTVLKKII